ncbi:YetF domain-containing protein [Marinisporobacter balticus]|uniref:Uncharacterized membrane protein YcaP (DUF421 family) n=1 Tax=Marinisporobacter balticus TaxID=2018667 RepID=A0A4R2KUX2_9FIRM|nr:DUF421 domain-containing protein [Marinisporobacter balticus]TCO74946.1 uncharacterized membrane protein YcaP (DUF421 family) [Marinisporobacter balticus]
MKLYLEIVIQTFLAFFTILFVTRLLGRQQISQLTFYEYVNGITFGSIAATLATDLDGRTMQHFIGLVLFGLLTGIFSFIALKNRSFRKVVEGEPVLVIQNGKILEKNLNRIRYSIDDLNVLLRQNDCLSAEVVDYGILESNGKLSTIKKPEENTVTLKDLNIIAKAETIPTEIIIGGQIIYENLKKRKLNGKDLMNKLIAFGVKRTDEVMYATIDTNGKMYVDKYNDQLKDVVDFSENNKNI